jgi:hypothetical protein
MDPNDNETPRILHTGEGKVLIGLTSTDIRDILEDHVPPDLYKRLEKALALLEYSKAREEFKRR